MSALQPRRRWLNPAVQFPPRRRRIEGKTLGGRVMLGVVSLMSNEGMVLLRSLGNYKNQWVYVWCTHWRQP